MAAEMGTNKATKVPQGVAASLAVGSLNIHAMPTPAMAIANQVLPAMWCFKKTRAIKAVTNGPIDMVINTSATVVSVSAIMNDVNMKAQHTPLNQTTRGALSKR
jgi:hypothetical protein